MEDPILFLFSDINFISLPLAQQDYIDELDSNSIENSSMREASEMNRDHLYFRFDNHDPVHMSNPEIAPEE